MRTLQMKTSIGYRDLLDRSRRFLSRIESIEPKRDVDYQDDVWAFFQNCWHIKDWIKNDPLIPVDVKKRIKTAAEDSAILKICNDMANGTKHRDLHKPQAFAQHSHTNTTIVPGGESKLDCFIEFGNGQPARSAREIAKECIHEWCSILTAENLATDQLS